MIPFPSKKYKIIYADPPWNFKTWSKKGRDRSPDKHYNLMSIDDIYNLPVQDIADDNCVLCLWVTYPMLPQGLVTLAAWGFKYTTVLFTWVKKCKIKDDYFMGNGYYTRANPEICLLGKKGKTLKRQSRSVRN